MLRHVDYFTHVSLRPPRPATPVGRHSPSTRTPPPSASPESRSQFSLGFCSRQHKHMVVRPHGKCPSATERARQRCTHPRCGTQRRRARRKRPQSEGHRMDRSWTGHLEEIKLRRWRAGPGTNRGQSGERMWLQNGGTKESGGLQVLMMAVVNAKNMGRCSNSTFPYDIL